MSRTAENDAPRWDDDPNHPEAVDCDGYPLSSGERCGRSEHRPYVRHVRGCSAGIATSARCTCPIPPWSGGR